MKNIKLSAILTILASTALCGCSSHDWNPGPAEPESNVGVFFSTDNPSYCTVEVNENPTIDVVMRRVKSNGAVSVPVASAVYLDGEKLDDKAGMEFPATVDFADGQSEAIYSINVQNMVNGKEVEMSLAVDEQYVHTYAAGVSVYTAKAMASVWDSCPTSFTVYDNATSYTTPYESVSGTIEHFRRSNLYRIPDFLNSGFTYRFSTADLGFGGYENDFVIVPQPGEYKLMTEVFSDWEDYGDHPYLLYDPVNDSYPYFVLTNQTSGETETLYYPLISQYYDNSSYCSYVNVPTDGQNCFGWVNFYGFLDENLESYSPYMYICWYWDQPTE